MNTFPTSLNMMQYAFGWSSPDEQAQLLDELATNADLTTQYEAIAHFATTLQEQRWQNQANVLLAEQATLDDELTQIERLVLGDLSEQNVLKVNDMVQANTQYRYFFDQLQILQKHLDSVDSPTLLPKLRDWVNRGMSALDLTMPASPDFAFRGESDGFIPLNIPPFYGFEINLYVSGFDNRRRNVHGELSTIEQTNKLELDQARVWLVPEEGKYKKSRLQSDNMFEFTHIPPGNYTFEMAWSDQFLEVLDVVIPTE